MLLQHTASTWFGPGSKDTHCDAQPAAISRTRGPAWGCLPAQSTSSCHPRHMGRRASAGLSAPQGRSHTAAIDSSPAKQGQGTAASRRVKLSEVGRWHTTLQAGAMVPLPPTMETCCIQLQQLYTMASQHGSNQQQRSQVTVLGAANCYRWPRHLQLT